MTDRELLELAAKAVGYEVAIAYQPDVPRGLYVRHEDKTFVWMPLIDDADAFCLAVKLHLKIDILPWGTIAARWNESMYAEEAVRHNNDPYAATRRAIVKAAAEIGRNWLTRAIMNNEALILAEQDEKMSAILPVVPIYAAELRRLHEVNQELVEALEGVTADIKSLLGKSKFAHLSYLPIAEAALAKARGTE